MRDVKVENAEDGTVAITGLTVDQAWMLYSGVQKMWEDYDDQEARQLAEAVSTQLEANGHGA